jgi:hypothetical protein
MPTCYVPADDDLKWMRNRTPLWDDMKGWIDAAPLTWGAFLLRPGRRKWVPGDLASLPMRSGIYALCMADGGIVYIGRSRTLHERLKSHFYNVRGGRSLRYDCFTFVQVPEHALEAVEIAHIHALEPERNTLFEPPEWSGHDAMVDSLRAIWQVEETT